MILWLSLFGLSAVCQSNQIKTPQFGAFFTNHNYTLLWAWRCRESPRKKSTKGRKFLWFCQFSIIILSMSIINRNSHHSDHNMIHYNNQPLMSRKIPADLLKSVEQFGIKNAEILPSGCGRLSNGNINGSLWVEK